MSDIGLSSEPHTYKYQCLHDISEGLLHRYFKFNIFERIIHIYPKSIFCIFKGYLACEFFLNKPPSFKQLFFQNQHSIDRVQLESGFNAFIERREYYVSKVADDGLSSLVYFIVLREMMHHWNVVEMKLDQV